MKLVSCLICDKEDIGVRDILYCFAYSGLRTSELWKSKLKYDKVRPLNIPCQSNLYKTRLHLTQYNFS